MSEESRGSRSRRWRLRWVIGVFLAVAWLAATLVHLVRPPGTMPLLDERSLGLLWDLAVLALLLVQSRALWHFSTRGEPAVGSDSAEDEQLSRRMGAAAAPEASAERTATASGREEHLEWAYRLASRRVDGLEQRWRVELRQSGPPRRQEDGDDQQRAARVADRAEELASAFRALGEAEPGVRNLVEMAARLRAAMAGEEGAGQGLRELVPLQAPAEWRATGGEEPIDYLRLLLDAERRAEEVLGSASQRRPEIDWRGPAQAMLTLVGARRPPEGAPDPHRLRDLHAALLELLGYEEIAVRIDDAVDRDIHNVECVRATREHRPNRVIELIAPGYTEKATGKVWRKALVVLSEQHVG